MLSPFASAATPQSHVSTSGAIGGFIVDHQSLFASGGKAAIETTIYPKYLNLTRGESGSVSITLHHYSNSPDYPVLHVLAQGNLGLFGLPSSNKNMSAFDRAQYFIQGKQPPGLIDLSPYITYHPSQFEVAAGQSTTITATVTLPKDFPDEAVGLEIQFSPHMKILDVENNPQEQQKVGYFNDIFWVNVKG